ncbi:MAG TPA: efflux RND transporter permease subunit [Chloroflexota bacterium]|nr:efflux RND transporter permease subunit [Chloroflexota bacterium]
MADTPPPNARPPRSFWLAELAIGQPVFITMLALAVLVVGILAYRQMGLDLFPDVSLPVVVVQTVYPGASPSDVVDTVSKPIEDAVSSLNGVDSVHSTSSAGVSLVVVEFGMDQDPKAAADAVRARLDLIRGQLPSDAQAPIVESFDPSAAPILAAAIADTSGQRSPAALRSLVDGSLKPALEQVPGVAAVDVTGGQVEQIQVALDRDRLARYGLAPDRVVGAIQAATLNVPAGQVPNGASEALLSTRKTIQSPDELAAAPVEVLPNGAVIRVRDVATVQEAPSDVQALARLDGHASVTVSILKQSGTNTVEVADATKAKLNELAGQYPGLSVAVAADQSTYTRQSIDELQQSLLIGALLAALVVLFFFRDPRNTLVTVAGLPVILLGTLAVLNLFGVTLNVISMLGISLSIGMLIDDAIVVRENIYRHVEAGETPRQAAAHGTAEIAPAVVAVTSTIVAVFLPIAFTSGIAGKFLRDFGLTVAVAVLVSLVEAFTLAPMLSAHFFKGQAAGDWGLGEGTSPSLPVGEKGSGVEGSFPRTPSPYGRALAFALGHRWVVGLLAVLSLVGSGVLAARLPVSFVPAGDQGQFTVSLTLAPGTPLATTDRAARAVETVLRGEPTVAHVFTTVGATGGGGNVAQLDVTLEEAGETAAVVARLRPRIGAAIPGVSFTVDTQSSASSAGGGAAANAVNGRPIQFSVRGDDPTEVDQVSADLVRRLKAIDGAVDVARSLQPGAPELAVELDPNKAAQDGLTPAGVGATLRAMVQGETAGTVQLGGQNLDVVVQLAAADRQSPADLLKLPLATVKGSTVLLSDVGQLTQSTVPSEIDRQDRENEVIVGADSAGRSQGAVLGDAEAVVQSMARPAGVTIEASGQTQYTEQMTSALGLAMGLAVLFVYMILASQFGSFVQPLIIMLALPFSFLGSFVALYLGHFDLDMLGMIGMILLMGLVAKNSILLVDLANQFRRAGASAREAMLAAGPIRLRPILMTTLAMIGGMIPVAVGIGAGSALRQPMGVSVIGGLLTSTALTLLVVPVAYTVVADLGAGLRALPGRLAGLLGEGGSPSLIRVLGLWLIAFGVLGALVFQASTESRPAATFAVAPTRTPSASVPTPAAFPTVPLSNAPPDAAPAPAPPAVPPALPDAASPPTSVATPSSGASTAGVAQVGNTGGLGLNLRGGPGTNNPVVASLSDGTQLVSLGNETTADGHVWLKVRTSGGAVGWVAQDYLRGQ